MVGCDGGAITNYKDWPCDLKGVSTSMENRPLHNYVNATLTFTWFPGQLSPLLTAEPAYVILLKGIHAGR